MARQHVLDDRQTQPGAAGFPRTAAVHAVEALGQARHVLRRDADAGVGHREFAGPLAHAPDEVDPPARRRVAHGVADQVAEGAAQLAGAAGQRRRRFDRQRELVLAAGQRPRFVQQAAQHRLDLDALLAGQPAARLQGRQRQQVLDQALHAPVLFADQRQVMPDLGVAVLLVAVHQHFGETGDHRQRRLEFMRDVGDEVAAHGFQAFDLGDVARHHQAVVVAVGNHLQHQHQALDPAVAVDQRLVEAAAFQVGDEIGLADQVGQRLPAVGQGREREMHLGPRIDPLDVLVAVEGDHPVGQRLEGAHEAVQRLGERALLAEAQAHPPVQAGEGDLPDAAAARQRRVERAVLPVQQLRQGKQVPGEQQRQAAAQRQQAPHRAERRPRRQDHQAEQRQQPPEGAYAERPHAPVPPALNRAAPKNGSRCRAPSGSGDRAPSFRAPRAGAGYARRRCAPRRTRGRPTPGRAAGCG